MLLLSVNAYLGVILPAVKSECPLAVSLTDTPSTRFTSTWGRAQDWKPPCNLYVVPGISTPHKRLRKPIARYHKSRHRAMKRGLVKWHTRIRRPLPKTGGNRLGGFFPSAFGVDIF